MAILCPQNVILYYPNAQPGQQVVLTIAGTGNTGLGVSDDNGANVFFNGTAGAPGAVIQQGDDIDDITFFGGEPGAIPPGGFRNAGAITNDGQTITYTFDDTMEVGDCIFVEYNASTGAQVNGDCTQTFQICVKQEGVEPEPGVLDCIDGSGYTPNIDNRIDSALLITTPAVTGWQFESVFVTNSDGDTISDVSLVDGNQSLVLSQNLPGDTYTIQYQASGLVAGVRRQTLVCEVFYTISGGPNIPTCRNGVTVRLLTNGGLAIPSAPLSGDNASDATFSSMTVTNANGVIISQDQGLGLRTYQLPASTGVGTYSITYTLTRNGIESVECNSTVEVAIGNVAPGINNLNCAQTRWVSGTPQVVCGAAASEHDAILTNTDGTPFESATAAVQYILQAVPTGTVVTVVSQIAPGRFRFRIDASNATCIGRSTGYIGV